MFYRCSVIVHNHSTEPPKMPRRPTSEIDITWSCDYFGRGNFGGSVYAVCSANKRHVCILHPEDDKLELSRSVTY